MYNKDKAEQYVSVVFNRLNAFEQDTLEKIGRRIKKIGSLSAFDRQALKNMADISHDMKNITKELARITELNVEDIRNIYSQIVEDSGQGYKPLYDFRKIKYVPIEENEYAQAIVSQWAKQTSGTMINLSRTKALKIVKMDMQGNVTSTVPLQGAYQQIVDDAITAVSSGTATFNQAMRRSIEQIGESGIRVDYGDGITRSLSSAVRSNILYGTKMAVRSYDDYIGGKLGCDGCEIDAHSGCRPSHLPIQGLMCSMGKAVTVGGITYPSINDALSGGKSAAELMNDYGCLHRRESVILGVSAPRYTKKELEKIADESARLIEFDGKKKTLYEWKQAQRRLENEVRREQCKRVIAKASGQNELLKQCDDKIRTYRTAYDKLCSTVGLPNRTDKMAVFKGKRIDTKSGAVYNLSRSFKLIDDNAVSNPMSAERYEKMKMGLERIGIHVISATGDDLRYLHSLGAEASYGNGYIMHRGEVPSASAMFEEIIHSTQAKKYGEFVSSDEVELCAREIAANQMLTKHADAYGFDKYDKSEITENLKYWEERFRVLVGENYGSDKYNREI